MRIDIGTWRSYWRRWAVGVAALAVVAATAAAATSGAGTGQAGGASAVVLETATVATLDQLLDSHEFSSVTLTRAYLNRISSMNSRAPSLDAVRAINPDAATWNSCPPPPTAG